MRKSLLFLLLSATCIASAGSESEVNTESKKFGEYLDEQLLEGSGLSIWGKLNGSFVAINQSQTSGDDNATASLNGDIYLRYLKNDSCFAYGFQIGNKIKSGILKQGSAIVDTSYVFVETENFGSFKVGYTNSAGDSFSLSYAAVLTGYTGPDSCNLGAFFAPTSGSIISTGFERDDSKALKVVWLSPIIRGWSCGVSYSPSSRDGHLFKERRNKVEKDYTPRDSFADQDSYSRDNISGGISYEHGAPESFNYKISIAGWYAKSAPSVMGLRPVKGYNVGAILGYGDYKLALGYTDNGKSMLPSYISDRSEAVGYCYGADAGKIYNVGVGYTCGKLELSAGYFHAVKKFSADDRVNTNIATVAVQYNFDEVFSVYVEYNNIRAKTCERSMKTERASEVNAEVFGNNRANMLVIGSKINI